jgi:hypothetical protein
LACSLQSSLNFDQVAYPFLLLHVSINVSLHAVKPHDCDMAENQNKRSILI